MKTLKLFIAVSISVFALSGCAAIQHRDLSLEAKMSDTIFLDPETLNQGKPIFVRITNTSDFQEIDFNNILKNKLGAKGYKLTVSPKEAAYQIQANVLYLGKQKNDYTYEGALAGGFGGALTAAALTKNSSFGTQALASGATGLAAAGVGALVGSMVHVDTYFGICDVQIKEHVEGGVTGTVNSNLSQGKGTTVQTERNIKSDKQEYRTRVAVKAIQTNIDRNVACQSIAERLATQIAGMF